MEGIADRNRKAIAVQKEISLAKAVLYAEEELKDNARPASDKPLSDDWILRWREYASNISSDELLALWGRVLAGEVKAPGRFSLRMLDFMRSLDVGEAALISKVAPFAINDGFIWRKDPTSSASKDLGLGGISLNDLLSLQTLGIVSGVGSSGIRISIPSESHAYFECRLRCHGKILYVKDRDPNRKIWITIFRVTVIGTQVLSLGTFAPEEDMLFELAGEIKTQGYQVCMGNYMDVDEEHYKVHEDLQSL